MLTSRLREGLPPRWKPALLSLGLLGLYLLMTVHFVGCYLLRGHDYLDLHRFAHGYERLPFQTRLLLAPLFRWAENSHFMINYASHLAKNGYFFPNGVRPTEVLEFYLDIPCVLIAGWVAVRIYQAASRRHLLEWLVFPLFIVLCAVSYTLHTVQNYRFAYDLPSLAFFSLGLYLIYFRKSPLLLAALFAVATLNRETTLLLIPFYLLSELAVGHENGSHSAGGPMLLSGIPSGRPNWRALLRPQVLIPAALMLAYWAVWHVFIFHVFRNNASEYYSRVQFNLYCFRRLRYWPQLFSACGYLLPVLVLFRRHIHDAQLRMWMWAIPLWYGLMFFWGILVETRVFGEMLPFIAVLGVLIAEEAVVAAVARRGLAHTNDDDRVHLVKAA